MRVFSLENWSLGYQELKFKRIFKSSTVDVVTFRNPWHGSTECDHVKCSLENWSVGYQELKFKRIFKSDKKRLSYKQIKFHLKIFNLLITRPFLVRFENPYKLKLLLTPWSDLVWKSPQNPEKVSHFQNVNSLDNF